MFLNNFCASATPTTHTSTVTSVTATTDISIMTTTKQLTITEVWSTTIFSTIATTKIETVTITPIIQSCSPQVTNDGHDTTITTTVCPSYIQHDPEKKEAELTQPTQGGVSKSTGKCEKSMKSNHVTQQAPIVALGSLTGLFFIVLASVIIGWVWTCWTIKKRRGMGHIITSKNTQGNQVLMTSRKWARGQCTLHKAQLERGWADMCDIMLYNAQLAKHVL